MKDVKLMRSAKLKKESRDITKQILDFGVREEQKLDIIFNIALSLEDNAALKEIVGVLKRFRENINSEEEEDNNNDKNNKILIWKGVSSHG